MAERSLAGAGYWRADGAAGVTGLERLTKTCYLVWRQHACTLSHADRPLSAKSGRVAVASSLHPTHLL